MKVARVAVGLFAMFGAGTLFAQTCASPIQIQSNNKNGAWAPINATTCGGSNDFPTFPGGIPSNGPDMVHSFVAQGANATITLDAADNFTPAIVVLDACTQTANFVGAPAVVDPPTPGQALSLPVSGLTDGSTYFVIITHHPDAPEANQCGGFTGTITGQLPVEVQSFTVE